jgi:hypothetical protein
VWAKPLTSSGVQKWAVTLLNTGEASTQLGFNVTQLGLAPNTLVSLRDLWAHQVTIRALRFCLICCFSLHRISAVSKELMSLQRRSQPMAVSSSLSHVHHK